VWILCYSAYVIVLDVNLFQSQICSRKSQHTTDISLLHAFTKCFPSELLIFTALKRVQINIRRVKQRGVLIRYANSSLSHVRSITEVTAMAKKSM
jgi:hypothetical protein